MAKRRSQTAQPLTLKLTPLQREALVAYTRLKPKIKRKLNESGEGPQQIGFTQRELEHMQQELGEAALFAPSPEKRRVVAVQKKVEDSLDKLHAREAGVELPRKRRRSRAKSELLFQFKITLRSISPPVWRRIQMRDGTLADLHLNIQAAFGWWNYHLHRFVIQGKTYGVPSPDDLDFGLEVIDESGVRLSELLPKSGRRTRWIYEYDFGDGWRHDVLFEGYPPLDEKQKYPLCLEGARACPPEDVGGPWGYADYLEAIANPRHEMHEELLKWQGPFDPEAFDAHEATREMRSKR